MTSDNDNSPAPGHNMPPPDAPVTLSAAPLVNSAPKLPVFEGKRERNKWRFKRVSMKPDAVNQRASRAALKKLSPAQTVRIDKRKYGRLIEDLRAKRPDIRDGELTDKQFNMAVSDAMAELLERAIDKEICQS